MFESAELGHTIDKKTYAREEPTLRTELLAAQDELVQRKEFPVVLVIGGVDGAGKGETVNLLNVWMDPRHIDTHAFGPPGEDEATRPTMWRYWRALPPKGRIGIFFGSWYTEPIVRHVDKKSGQAELAGDIERIVHFERLLADEGALVLKFWFHLSKKDQDKRLKKLEKDPLTRWRVTKDDWKNFDRYDDFREVSERVLRQTSTPEAPWVVVEGMNARYRNLSVGKQLLSSLRERLSHPRPAAATAVPPILPSVDNRHILETLDLTKRLDEDAYEKKKEKLQGRVNRASRDGFGDRSVVVLFEGPDAAGKGGAIRRISEALDARTYHIVPIAAPTEEERAQPYLWRFWRHLPRRGHVTIFDRSWYGRVLVERVEGFCSESDYMRAYGEINDFEQQLVKANTVLVKFWLMISKEEQLTRFKDREETGFKRYKLTKEDWRNRKKWDAYSLAASEMVDRTSTEIAPWTLVEANDKYYARIRVLSTLARAINHRTNGKA
jgi:polyphosphate:AMP phosphotransferase